MTRAPEFCEWSEGKLPADLAAVEPALKRLGDDLRARGLTAEIWQQVQLAAAEALNNAIEHGCAGRADATVSLRWSWSGHDLEIRVHDPGFFEPPTSPAALPDDPLAEGGRGSYLVAQLMDTVSHHNGTEGHEIVMRKTTSLPARSAADSAATEHTLTLMTEELSSTYESLAALFSFSELLATSPSFADFLGESLARLRQLVSADKAFARLLRPDGSVELVVESTPEQTSAVPATGALPPLEQAVVSENHGRTVTDTTSLPADNPLAGMHGGGYLSPIGFQGRVLGVLVVARRTGATFTAGELNVVQTVGDFIAVARTLAELNRQREVQQRAVRELEIAAAIHQSLLPTALPTTPVWRVVGRCESAEVVGGDYFDAITCADGAILVVIADVMGKGLPASLLASIFRTSLRARLDLAADPGRLLTEINRQLNADLNAVDRFITAQAAWFHPAGGEVRLANAGHAPACVLSQNAEATVLDLASDMPIGILETVRYATATHRLAEGDALLMFTDGLFEIEGGDGRQLGVAGLAQHANQLWRTGSTEFPQTLLSFLADYARPGTGDDRTLVLTQFLPPP